MPIVQPSHFTNRHRCVMSKTAIMKRNYAKFILRFIIEAILPRETCCILPHILIFLVNLIIRALFSLNIFV